jgi:hypothetical protein
MFQNTEREALTEFLHRDISERLCRQGFSIVSTISPPEGLKDSDGKKRDPSKQLLQARNFKQENQSSLVQKAALGHLSISHQDAAIL